MSNRFLLALGVLLTGGSALLGAAAFGLLALVLLGAWIALAGASFDAPGLVLLGMGAVAGLGAAVFFVGGALAMIPGLVLVKDAAAMPPTRADEAGPPDGPPDARPSTPPADRPPTSPTPPPTPPPRGH